MDIYQLLAAKAKNENFDFDAQHILQVRRRYSGAPAIPDRLMYFRPDSLAYGLWVRVWVRRMETCLRANARIEFVDNLYRRQRKYVRLGSIRIELNPSKGWRPDEQAYCGVINRDNYVGPLQNRYFAEKMGLLLPAKVRQVETVSSLILAKSLTEKLTTDSSTPDNVLLYNALLHDKWDDLFNRWEDSNNALFSIGDDE